MKRAFYDTLKEQVRGYFFDYLRSRGLKVKGRSFQCPNHESHKHDDNNPSCQMFSDGYGGKCFRCDKYWDIFEAYKILDGDKPFIEILKSLGKEFAGYTDDDYINAEEKQGSADISQASKIYFTLRKLAGFLHEISAKNPVSILDRGWDDRNLNIFYDVIEIPINFNFREYLFNRLSEEEQNIIVDYFGNLLFDTIFSEGNIVFIVRDKDDNPVSFSARRKEATPKYIHNHNYDNIFKKSICLYGYTQLKDYDREKPLFIVEGYSDVVSLAYLGYPAVAIMGTSVAKEQAKMILEAGFKDIVFMLDNDEAGYKGNIKSIESLYFEFAEEGRTIYLFPWNKLKDDDIDDPDELIRKIFRRSKNKERLIKKFEDIALSYNIYKYYMDKYNVREKDDGTSYDRIFNFISKTNILTEHIRWARELSDVMGISTSLIIDEIHRRQSIKQAHRDSRMEEVAQKLSGKLYKYRRDGGLIYEAIEDAYNQSSNIIDEYMGELTDTPNGNIEVFDRFLSRVKTSDDRNYIKINWKSFSRIQFNGIARESVFTMISGGTHAGKSSILRNIVYQILDNSDENKDVVILFHSNDDDKARVFQALLSIISGVPIFNIRSYAKLLKSKSMFAMEAKDRLKRAEDILRDMLGGRLLITDVNDGNSIRFLSREIEKILNIGYYPVLFVDSISKLEEDTSFIDNPVERMGRIAISLKRKLSLHYHIPIFATSEKRKTMTSKKVEFITNDDVAGSRKLGYEPDVIILLQNEHARLSSNDSQYVVEEDDEFILRSGIKKFLGSSRIFNPYIEARITKNKFSGYAKRIYYILKSATTQMIELDEKEENLIGIKQDGDNEKEYKKDVPKDW